MVPEERRSEGLMLTRSVAFNINVAVLSSLRIVPWLPLISGRKARARARRLVDQLGIKTTDLNQPVGSLSGGNQQKALIARWLQPGIKVLFLDEPSRGVDVGARQDIHLAIRELADNGVGVVVISSDVEELTVLCDRVVVLHEGRVSGVVEGDDITEQTLVELSYGHSALEGALR
jgi:ribose transport system ATP-binding protein